jgi:hypothetical protein
MARRFERCRGKTACLETGTGCERCGRSREEIDATRALIAQATAFVVEQGYDNVGEFAAYLAERIEKKVRYQHPAN